MFLHIALCLYALLELVDDVATAAAPVGTFLWHLFSLARAGRSLLRVRLLQVSLLDLHNIILNFLVREPDYVGVHFFLLELALDRRRFFYQEVVSGRRNHEHALHFFAARVCEGRAGEIVAVDDGLSLQLFRNLFALRPGNFFGETQVIGSLLLLCICADLLLHVVLNRRLA